MILQTRREARIRLNQILNNRILEILHRQSLRILRLSKDPNMHSGRILTLRIFLRNPQTLNTQRLEFTSRNISIIRNSEPSTSHQGPGIGFLLNIETNGVGIDFCLEAALA